VDLLGRSAMEEAGKERLRPFRRLFTRVEALGLYLVSGFLVCGVVVLLFGVLAREVFRTPDTRAFDREVTLAMRELQGPENDRIARIVTLFGGHFFVIPATLVVTAALWLKHHWASALLFAGCVVGGFGLNALLKIAFARETWMFDFSGTPAEFVAAFRTYYGPTMNAFDAAEKSGRRDQLEAELTALFEAQNVGNGSTEIPATFLKVTATKN